MSDNGARRLLTDEGGVYSGLYDGQTFFAACRLEADVGDALLQILTSYPTTLLLDGELLYADAALRSLFLICWSQCSWRSLVKKSAAPMDLVGRAP